MTAAITVNYYNWSSCNNLQLPVAVDHAIFNNDNANTVQHPKQMHSSEPKEKEMYYLFI